MKLLPLEAQVERAVENSAHFPRDSAIVTAVSGGPDSVAMLLAMVAVNEHLQAGWRLHVAHLNHQLRGPEGDEDAAFVGRLSAGLSLPFHLCAQDVAARARVEKLGIEEAARKARYEVFHALAQEIGADVIAVGHTADDRVETVLQRVFRGTGVRGLAGIPAVRKVGGPGSALVVRPLLGVWRREVIDYLAQKGQSYRIDASNEDLAFRRNWLRHKLIPLIESRFGTQAGPAILRLAEIAQEAMEDVDSRACTVWDHALVRRDEWGVTLDRGMLASAPPVLRQPILRLACVALGLGERAMGFEVWQRLMRFVASPEPTGRLMLPGGYAERTADSVALRRARPPAPVEWSVRLRLPGHVCLPDVGVRIAAQDADTPCPADLAAALTHSGDEELIDADRVVPPVVVRPRRPGDAFHPLGAPGRRKLKRFFIDHKVQASLRGSIPLLVDQRGIVWVVGYRIDERVKITAATKRALKLSVSPMPS